MIDRRTFLTGSLAAGALAGFTACAPGSGQAPAPAGPAPDAVVTDPAAAGTVTIRVWDQEVRGGSKAALDELNSRFMAKYPNVTIERKSESFDDLKKTVALALSGNDVPDVVQVNNARADMGEFVKAGQLTDLTPYAAAYGWAERYPADVLAKSSYSADAVTFGSGNLYGLPQTGEVVGIFYSAKRLAELGIAVPQTWDEYLAALDAASAKGTQPMILGNIEKWPALHVFGPLQGAYVPADQIIALGMGNAGADWNSPENAQAMQAFADWSTKKYFGDSPNGLDYDAAWTDFTKGKGAFLPGGSWLAADMIKVLGDDLHFMVPPPREAGGAPVSTGGTGLPFTVPARAAQRDVAAAYIDFITSDEAMSLIAENDGLPVRNAAQLAPASGASAEIFRAFDEVSTKGSLLPYLDYATPTFADTAGNNLQELIAGREDPQQVLAAFSDDYGAFVGG